MPDISPRLSLLVPNDSTLFVTEDIAANWQFLDDTVVGFLSDVAASRPAASSANEGFLFYATDTEVISFSNGTDWVPVSVSDTDDLDEGSINLYYTDARADGRITAASVGDLSDVDTTGAASGDVLAFDGSEWVPQSGSGGGVEVNDESLILATQVFG